MRLSRVAFLACLLAPGLTRAEEAKPGEAPPKAAPRDDGKKKDLLSKIFEQGEISPVDQPTKDTRRDSFAFGLDVSALAGLAEGYPNDPRRVGRPEHFASTDAAFGGVGTFWVGGALRDFVNFGFGFTGGMAFGPQNRTPGYSGIVRVEAFPLFPLKGGWRDLGIGVDVGIGTASVERLTDGATLADGGAIGKLGVHVFWEGLRASKFGFGPTAGFDYSFSGPMSRPFATLGFRMAFYAKP